MRGGEILSRSSPIIRCAVFTAIFLILLTCVSSSKRADASTANVEVGSPVYEDIEYLLAVGLLDTAMIGALPLSREEIARLIVEAKLKSVEKKSLSELDKRVMGRLEEEFSEDIEDLKTGNDTIYYKPVREVELTYLFFDQEDSVYAGQGTEVPKRGLIDARQKAFAYNMEGIDFRKSNVVTSISSDGRFKMFSFFLKPHLIYKNDPSDDFNFTLQKAYAKFGSKYEIELGQDSRWWGQGRHGSVLLSNNAEPFFMISLRNAKPIILPVLGLFKFDTFLTRLEEERDFKRPYFFGMRFSLKPYPWLEFGLHRTAIFGGSGRPGLDFGDIMKILFGGKTETGEGDLANQVVGVDIRVHLPFIKTDVYYERGMEDFRDFYPYKEATLYGIYVADLYGFSLRGEFFDSTKHPGVWYRHETWTSGYTFKRKVIGHHAGGDAEDFFIEVGREISDHIKISGSFDLESRGTNQLITERHRQFAGKARLRFYPYFADIAAGWEEVDNPGFSPGSDENYYGVITLKRFF